MAITKEKKENIVKFGKESVQASDIVLFADYKGTSVADMVSLRRKLGDVGARIKVIKKRLMKIILSDSGIDIDPTKLEGQMAVVFASGDISDIAGPIYKFAKEHKSFELLGGIDTKKKEEIPLETIITIGTLPSRDELLAQVIGSITAPLRGLMYVLSEKSKK
jgi:large subunit ribosomal protein L10